MTAEQIMQKLAAPFPACDVEWRVQNTTQDKSRGMAVPFIDSRAIQNRLDSVVGIYNWKTEYRPWHQVEKGDKERKAKQDGTPKEVNASQLCGLSIYCEERKEWVPKWDGAENSDIEPVKGGISDSFKRAAVLWNVGRYLYDLDPVWVDIEPRGRSFAIQKHELERLDREYERAVQKKFGSVPPSPHSRAEAPDPPKQPKTASNERRQAKGNTVDFEYAVKSVSTRNFASGKGMVVVLHNPSNSRSVTAFLQGEHPELAEGICLKNVRLSQHENGSSPYHTLDGFRIAA
ncbi:Rad52/Rad22 family DNA repair protein [Anaerotruncus rubiinfantis]|uniref:Rad52/Rad22 family DNA repair protein n=1 Tax=Anaerotruncus rubiinfantis TaxID=1720200 RepID=UPI003D796A0D